MVYNYLKSACLTFLEFCCDQINDSEDIEDLSGVEYDENDVDEGYSETTSTSCETIDDKYEHCETSTETYDEVGTPTE